MLLRPVRWDYFYDEIGRRLVTLVRRLLDLRRHHPHLRSGDHYFYNDSARYQAKRVLLFSRADESRFTLVALNFGDIEQVVPFRFPIAGDYREELHGADNLHGVSPDADQLLTIPSNYGRIWNGFTS